VITIITNKDVSTGSKSNERADGRAFDELRPFKIEAGVLERAEGSPYLEIGGNKIMAAVYGPRELHIRRLMQPDRAVLRCRYNMAPFSVDDRKRPGPDRRSVEISKITSEAIMPAVFLEKFPRSTIDVFIEILQAEGGTRCAGITAASVALADAGVPMRDMVVACAAGKSDGEVVLDLSEAEDKDGEADVPVAIIPSTGEVTLLQSDGTLTSEEFAKALNLAIDGCMILSNAQKDALIMRYGE
jgi:exosome complex component RRP41